jgi:presenilin-like A22 family membrane protease
MLPSGTCQTAVKVKIPSDGHEMSRPESNDVCVYVCTLMSVFSVFILVCISLPRYLNMSVNIYCVVCMCAYFAVYSHLTAVLFSFNRTASRK